jgi:serine/threonine protein kinase
MKRVTPPTSSKKSKTKKEQIAEETPIFVVAGGKPLAAGGYNAAFRLENNQGVLRVGLLQSAEEAQDQNLDVKRGLAIVHALNAEALVPLLGPSLLKELTKYQIIDALDWDQHVSGANVPKLAEQDDQFALQHIEFLAGGEFTNRSKTQLNLSWDEVRFSLFSLLWFTASGQQYLGLRHHDLKAKNIMFRTTEEPTNYSFHLKRKNGGDLFFDFTSSVVPVVIDFDLASVETTRSKESRNFPGTRYACSPDSLIYKICQENEIPMEKVYNEEVLDYWAIGYSMLEMVLPFDYLWKFFENVAKEFSIHAVATIQITNVEDYIIEEEKTVELLQYIFYACCIQSFVLHETRGGPYVGLSSEWYMFSDARIWTDASGISFTDIIANHPHYQSALTEFNALPVDLKSVLRILMSENPAERNQNDVPAKLLTHIYFSGKKKPKPKSNYTYRMDELNILEDTCQLKHIISKYHPWIETALCSSCVDPSKKESYWCKCCNRVFCGVACQMREH